MQEEKILLLNVNGKIQGLSLPDAVSLTKQGMLGFSSDMTDARSGKINDSKLTTKNFIILI